MKQIINKSKLILTIFFFYNTNTNAQYKAIDLSVSTSPYLDDNMDSEFDYTFYNQRALGHYILGYSFPISSHMTLTPRAGVSSVDAQYNTIDPFSQSSNPTFSAYKEKNFLFGHASITGSYWLKQNFTGLFFTGELWTITPLSATSETVTSTLIQPSTMTEYEREVINRDIKDQMQSLVPIMSIGVGYNLKIAYGFHVFANMNIDYRPTGFFKDTENVTSINRRTTLGVKYVIEKANSDNQDLPKDQ